MSIGGVRSASFYDYMGKTALDFGVLVGRDCEFVVLFEDNAIDEYRNRSSMVTISDSEWDLAQEKNFTESHNVLLAERFDKLENADRLLDELFAGNLTDTEAIKSEVSNVTTAMFIAMYLHQAKRILYTEFYTDAFQDIQQRLKELQSIESNANNENCQNEIEHLMQKTKTHFEICERLTNAELDLQNVKSCDFISDFATEIDEFMPTLSKEKHQSLSKALHNDKITNKFDISEGLLCFSKSLRALLVHEVYGLKNCEFSDNKT